VPRVARKLDWQIIDALVDFIEVAPTVAAAHAISPNVNDVDLLECIDESDGLSFCE
jgi:hypothetical protein